MIHEYNLLKFTDKEIETIRFSLAQSSYSEVSSILKKIEEFNLQLTNTPNDK